MNRGWTPQRWSRERPPRPDSWLERVDFPVLLATLSLCLVGGLSLASVHPELAVRQLIFAGIGVGLATAAAFADYRWWARAAVPLALASLFLLALVMVPGVGQSANGAQRWLGAGSFGFQPSELAKLALVVLLARILAEGAQGLRLAGALGMSALFFVLIALQPDLGTATVLGAICLVMCFAAGASPVVLLGLVTAALGVLPYVLHDYQRDRLLVFMHPELDPNGLGYSLNQSKTAIGSGGTMGSGLTGGHMTQHGFVPENWTDFIFSAMGEEMGFLGCLGFLLLAVLLCFSLVRVALRQKDRFGSLLVMGVWGMLVFQFVVNMGMTTGVAPVVGIPLPFASYGGTALVVNLLSIGIVLSVSQRARVKVRPWEDRAWKQFGKVQPLG